MPSAILILCRHIPKLLCCSLFSTSARSFERESGSASKYRRIVTALAQKGNFRSIGQDSQFAQLGQLGPRRNNWTRFNSSGRGTRGIGRAALITQRSAPTTRSMKPLSQNATVEVTKVARQPRNCSAQWPTQLSRPLVGNSAQPPACQPDHRVTSLPTTTPPGGTSLYCAYFACNALIAFRRAAPSSNAETASARTHHNRAQSSS